MISNPRTRLAPAVSLVSIECCGSHKILGCLVGLLIVFAGHSVSAQGTRLLRSPSLSDDSVAFAHGADLWVVSREGGVARRLTSTPAVESDPVFSPDGRQVAFTSNRSGTPAVYVVDARGGTPKRLTWHPAPSAARGWTSDGRVLYASTRETAPIGYNRLWTVPSTGGPSEVLPAPWAYDGSMSPSGERLAVDRVSRWDGEWRGYRGGQNTALVLLDLDDLDETFLPNERTTDVQPVWLGDTVYFLSDRDWVMNVWAYDTRSAELRQITQYTEHDIKTLSGRGSTLAFEQHGYVHTLDTETGSVTRLEIEVRGDFPWAEPRWEDVAERISSASLSPTGKRALFEARGDIFTVPADKGVPRNLTRSSEVADRRPLWSPDGEQIAWFSDESERYELVIADQKGAEEPRRLTIGESKLAWEPTWSPDGELIAFVDDDVRIRVVELESGEISTVDIGGINIERGGMGLEFSPDSQWLVYAKTFPNNFRRIVTWSRESGDVRTLTGAMADAFAPAWDRGGKHLYFLASTDVALGSGWANTSTIGERASYGLYVAVLSAEGETPFPLESDEEGEKADEHETTDGGDESDEEGSSKRRARVERSNEAEAGDGGPNAAAGAGSSDPEPVRIDFAGFERRVLATPLPLAPYVFTLAGPAGNVLVAERGDGPGLVLHTFDLEEREADVTARGVRTAAISGDGSQLLLRVGNSWKIQKVGRPSGFPGGRGSFPGAAAPGESGGGGTPPMGPGASDGMLDVTLRMKLDRAAEWGQMFKESWRYLRDYFYDPGLHGNDWDEVWDRYSPLLPHIRHRSDLSYVMDQMSGELSVGHSFVFGGDLPEVEENTAGLLGADLVASDGYWQIERIYTFESWNPTLTAPLDQPGLRVEEGHYVVGIGGQPLDASMDPFRLLDGTAGRQTPLLINDSPSEDGAWQVTVEPVGSEAALRQRAWVEDNRRRVDQLSGGKLAYVWVPNTGGPGVVSFDRYLFAQQDKRGAVIDERFNGGGLLDDYMVDLMTRSVRAAITNEVPEGAPFRLPAGVLGPKVLLINEMAGSGGDFFPWVFRQQEAGPLIGAQTWGGLVKSSVHYALVDGGALTSPDNAVFDPVEGEWIGENVGIAPDIEVYQGARAVAEGRDPQLERGVEELLRVLPEDQPIAPPPFPRPSKRPGR